MTAWQIWKRLLWKELREGWAIAAAAFAAPHALLSAPGAGAPLAMYSWPLLHILVILWAAGKANRNKSGEAFAQTHLPGDAFAGWFCSFLLPMLVCAAAGVSLLLRLQTGTVEPRIVDLVAVDMAATFAVCYLISAIGSFWAAVAMGAIRAGSGGLIVFAMQGPYESIESIEAVEFVIRTWIGCAAGTAVFAVLARRWPFQYKQIAALLTAAVIITVPLSGPFQFDSRQIFWWRDTAPEGGIAGWWFQDVSPYYTPTRDRQGTCFSTRRSDYLAGYDRLEYIDPATGKPKTCLFKRDIGIVRLGRDESVLAQQLPGSDRVKLIFWDLKSGKTRETASVKLKKDAFNRFDMSSVSPDRRYVLMKSTPPSGSGVDLWVMDVVGGNAELVLDNAGIAKDDILWLKDRVFLSGTGRPAIVDLRTKRGKILACSRGRI
ncbi:MAG: hypothetical protein Q7T82_03210 [Armatimonadota bacterium]|nr:hypothetical protein [Armatimonadota bacterium]